MNTPLKAKRKTDFKTHFKIPRPVMKTGGRDCGVR
jgi:hypothetical protein